MNGQDQLMRIFDGGDGAALLEIRLTEILSSCPLKVVSINPHQSSQSFLVELAEILSSHSL